MVVGDCKLILNRILVRPEVFDILVIYSSIDHDCRGPNNLLRPRDVSTC